jgi:hypothetical protein
MRYDKLRFISAVLDYPALRRHHTTSKRYIIVMRVCLTVVYRPLVEVHLQQHPQRPRYLLLVIFSTTMLN